MTKAELTQIRARADAKAPDSMWSNTAVRGLLLHITALEAQLASVMEARDLNIEWVNKYEAQLAQRDERIRKLRDGLRDIAEKCSCGEWECPSQIARRAYAADAKEGE